MEVDGAGGDAPGLRTFEEAKSTLYGTISSGAALASASRRRKSTVTNVAAYLDRIQLDITGLSVIHVAGTKGKGSTCAMVESVLRHHGFRTGLYTSPHLLEVTERVRCDGKPLTKEAFARYFFQVWDRLQATSTQNNATTIAITDSSGGTTTETVAASVGPRVSEIGPAAAAEETNAPEMPTYFHLLTLVGLWCFVQEEVDVCVLEVGIGGRFDATNVVPSPVACGVTLLDLDHTQVLGDTLEKIAWEKGGIFKEGCRAMAVEQPRGGMSVLRECAEKAGCGELEVVKPLPARDPSGRAYEINLAGEHQRVNAGLALRLCAVWMEALQHQPTQQQQQQQQQQQERHSALSLKTNIDIEAFWGSAEVHRGLSSCVWPGRCQVFRPSAFPSVTVYLDGAHTEQSMHACLAWFVDKTAAAAAAATTAKTDVPPTPPTHSDQQRRVRRRRRLLWFNASHERDVVPLLDMLALARRQASRSGASVNATSNNNNDEDVHGDVDEPLFDEAWFMEGKTGRPSRFAPPTAEEILASHGISPAVTVTAPTAGEVRASGVGSRPGAGSSHAVGSNDSAAVSNSSSGEASNEGSSDDATSGRAREEAGGAEPGTAAGAWQRTLEQVWISLQTRRGGKLSATLTDTAPKFLGKLSLMGAGSHNEGGDEVASMTGSPSVSCGVSALAADAGEVGTVARCGGEVVDILCTGSLYAVAEALEAFGVEAV